MNPVERIGRPYPWEQKVTICIAAGYSEKNKRGVVLCSDWRVSSMIGSADTMLKQRTLPHNFRCLTSGTDSEILALVKLFEKHLASTRTLDETNVIPLIKDALNERKKQKTDEFIQGKYALTYDDFLNVGKEKLPPDLFRDAVVSIRDIGLGTDCVIAGLIDQIPMLIETRGNCTAVIKEDFAVVGSGEILARASLLQREHSDVRSLSRTIYNVYEAKKYAEKISTVGVFTTLSVVYPDNSIRMLSNDGRNFLDQKFKEFGPQHVPQEIPLEDKFLNPLPVAKAEGA